MVAGLVPLGLGAVLLVRESDRAARTSQDARLSAVASGEGAALTESFARARALIGVTANSPVWRDIVSVPGPVGSAVAADGQPIRRVHAALIALRAGYGPLAGEADAVDDAGRQLALVLPSGPAPAPRLAADESHAPFFLPSMTLPPGVVFQALPYISPDITTGSSRTRRPSTSARSSASSCTSKCPSRPSAARPWQLPTAPGSR